MLAGAICPQVLLKTDGKTSCQPHVIMGRIFKLLKSLDWIPKRCRSHALCEVLRVVVLVGVGQWDQRNLFLQHGYFTKIISPKLQGTIHPILGNQKTLLLLPLYLKKI